MARFNSKGELLSSQTIKKKGSHLLPCKDPILCNHCKRTASNGIRCMGICVADNDY